jgi:hypothetical protein
MNEDQIIIFKAALVSSIEAHLQNGGVMSESRFVYNNERCPIACLAHEEKKTGNHNLYYQAVSAKLGFEVSMDEMYCFMDGFDAIKNHNIGTELYEFGQELRRKYLKGMGY